MINYADREGCPRWITPFPICIILHISCRMQQLFYITNSKCLKFYKILISAILAVFLGCSLAISFSHKCNQLSRSFLSFSLALPKQLSYRTFCRIRRNVPSTFSPINVDCIDIVSIFQIWSTGARHAYEELANQKRRSGLNFVRDILQCNKKILAFSFILYYRSRSILRSGFPSLKVPSRILQSCNTGPKFGAVT